MKRVLSLNGILNCAYITVVLCSLTISYILLWFLHFGWIGLDSSTASARFHNALVVYSICTCALVAITMVVYGQTCVKALVKGTHLDKANSNYASSPLDAGQSLGRIHAIHEDVVSV